MCTARLAHLYGGTVQTHGGQRHPEAGGALFAGKCPHVGAPYPGIPELLDELRAQGVQCAVFSNKADPLCGKIIAHYFGTGRFDAVRGSRPGVPTKPNPAGLYALMDEIGADRSATLFVGDSDVDILTGHNAGLPAMGALWGFRGRAELTAAGADALAAVPEDIFTYIQKG